MYRLLITVLIVSIVLSGVPLWALDFVKFDWRDKYWDLEFTYDELLSYYRAVTRRWYRPETYRLFFASYNYMFGYFSFMYYSAMASNVTLTVHEADIIGGVVYLYPPPGLEIKEVVGYENVYVVSMGVRHPHQFNFTWAVNFIYDYLGMLPRALLGDSEWNLYKYHEQGIHYYTLLAPDYYILDSEPMCVLDPLENTPFPPEEEQIYRFVVNNIDVLKYLCSKPPWLNITYPHVIIRPELYEELRVQHGVYPIYIWVNTRIRYVAIMAGIETTIGGIIRPDALRLINKYTGLNLTNDYVVLVVVMPMFSTKAVKPITPPPVISGTIARYGFYSFCSWTGCMISGFRVDVFGFNFLYLTYNRSLREIQIIVEDLKSKYGSDFPVYFDTPIIGAQLRVVYTYQPKVVVPEGVCHVKPTYDYLLLPDYLRDLRAGNLTLPPPNTECVYANGSAPVDEPGVSPAPSPSPTTTIQPTQTTSAPVETTTLPPTGGGASETTSPTSTPTITTIIPPQSTTTLVPTPTETQKPVVNTPISPIQCPDSPDYWLLVVGLLIGFLLGVSLTFFRKKPSG